MLRPDIFWNVVLNHLDLKSFKWYHKKVFCTPEETYTVLCREVPLFYLWFGCMNVILMGWINEHMVITKLLGGSEEIIARAGVTVYVGGRGRRRSVMSMRYFKSKMLWLGIPRILMRKQRKTPETSEIFSSTWDSMYLTV